MLRRIRDNGTESRPDSSKSRAIPPSASPLPSPGGSNRKRDANGEAIRGLELAMLRARSLRVLLSPSEE
ncbi:hypothetical protein GW17_00060330 [Ensete ventricosum]|nr:hypothetical protein GW17_00060330 [Ensete ventricosum]